MVMMSAAIAILGLLLSSPAVVIGTVLISPSMSPILSFSLALVDFSETWRSPVLAIGAVAAALFTALQLLKSEGFNPNFKNYPGAGHGGMFGLSFNLATKAMATEANIAS